MIAKTAKSELNKVDSPNDVIVLEGIVSDAGKIARNLFDRRHEFLVNEKSPGQFVSDADRQVEDVLRQELSQHFGERPIVGEEYGGTFDGEGWVIDPIDGTSNFLCGIPMWSISVAYMQNNRPVLAAVYAPMLDMLVTAALDHGLRYNCEPYERRSEKSVVPTYSIGENAVWTREHVRQTADELRAAGYEILRLRSASHSLALVALGMLDGYVENHLKLWDIAGGWLLCEEGGVPVAVSQHDGHERSIWAGSQQ